LSARLVDTIFVTGIEFHAYHGASAEERSIGHRYRVDVVLEYEIARAAANDSLEETLDYSRIAAAVLEAATQGRFKLVETVAERIASLLLDRFPAKSVRVRLAKLNPPMPVLAAEAGVEILRCR
jgi:dihydroneopterin aldolase